MVNKDLEKKDIDKFEMFINSINNKRIIVIISSLLLIWVIMSSILFIGSGKQWEDYLNEAPKMKIYIDGEKVEFLKNPVISSSHQFFVSAKELFDLIDAEKDGYSLLNSNYSIKYEDSIVDLRMELYDFGDFGALDTESLFYRYTFLISVRDFFEEAGALVEYQKDEKIIRITTN